MRNSKSPQVLNEYFTLKNEISHRIEVLENFFDDNLNNGRYLSLQKGIIKLKRLLFYYPDANNELEDADIPYFRGIEVDQETLGMPPRMQTSKTMAGKPSETKKHLNKSAVMNAKKQGQKVAGGEAGKEGEKGKEGELNHSTTGGKLRGTSKGKNTLGGIDEESKEAPVIPRKEKVVPIKKTIRVRLTADEYKLLEKLKAKRTLTVK